MNMLINARGEQCPIPVVKASQALGGMTSGTLDIHVDNDIAVQNLQRLAQQKQVTIRVEKKAADDFAVFLTVSGPVPAGDVPLSCSAPGCSNWVVAVDTACMGRGDDALGATLMKGFLYALSQLEQLPRTILFYNGGAHLTVEGSDSLEDLKAMADRGVDILTCGTCLNFYGLTERLAVGEVTNMYTIVEKLSGADRVVKP